MKKFIILSLVLLMLAGFVITSLACYPVPIDIKPESCPNPLNVKSKGVLPVAILGFLFGTEVFDVTEIDPATIKLEGVTPLRWDLEDVATPFEPFNGIEDCMTDCHELGPDGLMDLTLKFDIEEIVDALGEVDDGDCLVLTLTFYLFAGPEYDYIGKDVIIIIKKGK